MMDNLAIIILVYNSFDDAFACINQLLQLHNRYRVIVVDNCSTDGSFEQLKEKFSGVSNIDLLQTAFNSGYSAGNNYGIRYAMKKYNIDTVAIMNPDVIIPDDSVFISLINLLWDSDDVLAVGGQPINALDNGAEWISGWSLPTNSEVVLNHFIARSGQRRNDFTLVKPNVYRADCIVGCFFLTKAHLFADLGLFDENVFLYNEENIIGKKCERAGLHLLLDKSQLYFHNHRLKSRSKNFLHKLRECHIGFNSRMYLVKTYYSNTLALPLSVIEFINCFVIFAGHIKELIHTRLLRS